MRVKDLISGGRWTAVSYIPGTGLEGVEVPHGPTGLHLTRVDAHKRLLHHPVLVHVLQGWREESGGHGCASPLSRLAGHLLVMPWSVPGKVPSVSIQ